MAQIMMTSRWGVQVEGDATDIDNLRLKLDGTIDNPEAYFISMALSVPILRTSLWDSIDTPGNIYQQAVSDLSMLQGCLNVLDGCLPMSVGTTYRYDGSVVHLSRASPITVWPRRPPNDLGTPKQYRIMLDRVSADENLREAFSDLTPNATWIEIYRSIEAVAQVYGGKSQMYKALPSEETALRKVGETANTYRHARNTRSVKGASKREDAIVYVKGLLIWTVMGEKLPLTAAAKLSAGELIETIDHPIQHDQLFEVRELVGDL